MSDQKSRKELLKQQDAFVSAANDSARWLASHRAPAILTVSAVVIATVTVWGIVEYRDARDSKASALYATALKVADAQVAPTNDANAKADPDAFATTDDRDKAARDAFRKVVSQSPGSGVAKLARFYVADLSARLGERDAAINELSELRRDLSQNDNLYFLAVERLAYLYEDKGQHDQALATWQQLVGSSKRFYADHALYHVARLYYAKGDVQKAREMLRRFDKEFATSQVREDVDELYQLVGRGGDVPGESAQAQPGGMGSEKKAEP